MASQLDGVYDIGHPTTLLTAGNLHQNIDTLVARFAAVGLDITRIITLASPTIQGRNQTTAGTRYRKT